MTEDDLSGRERRARAWVSVPLADLRRCLLRAEHAYARLETDVAPGECWAEVRNLTSLLDALVPDWREENDDADIRNAP